MRRRHRCAGNEAKNIYATRYVISSRIYVFLHQVFGQPEGGRRLQTATFVSPGPPRRPRPRGSAPGGTTRPPWTAVLAGGFDVCVAGSPDRRQGSNVGDEEVAITVARGNASRREVGELISRLVPPGAGGGNPGLELDRTLGHVRRANQFGRLRSQPGRLELGRLDRGSTRTSPRAQADCIGARLKLPSSFSVDNSSTGVPK
jgi:hypothetical protein